MYRCAHGMIKALELRVLELTPQFYSDALPQYLEEEIRDTKCVVRTGSPAHPTVPGIYFFPLFIRAKNKDTIE